MSSIFIFDAYGTLFDVHAAIARHKVQAGPEADRISAIWRTKQLEYSWTLTLAGHYTDFWTLTQRALDYALASVPSVDKSLKPALLDAYFKLDAFPDARIALKALKAKGRKTGILSNGSPAMLKGAVEAAAIGDELDAGLSPGPGPIPLLARRRHLRLVEPLGRDGRSSRGLSRYLGQSFQHAGRISGLSTGTRPERAERTERDRLALSSQS